MVVRVAKRHLNICEKIAKEVNRSIVRFSILKYKSKPEKYEHLIDKTNISIEEKKKKLIGSLHDLLIRTVGVELKNPEKLLEGLRSNIRLLRGMSYKLRDINYYLENVFLKEIGLSTKKIDWKTYNKEKAIKLIKKEKGRMSSSEFRKIEHTILKLIEKTINLDKRLLKNYQKREIKVVEKEKVEIEHLEKILDKETETLMHIESKLPPPGKVKANLLKPKVFRQLTVMLTALLASLENEYAKEKEIFEKLKQNETLRKRIELKISHLVKEKFELLKIKEQRLMAWESAGKVNSDMHETAHAYLAASKL